MDHSDQKYECEEMTSYPNPGITININKIPWSGEVGDTQEEEQAEDSNTNSEEIIVEEPVVATVKERLSSFAEKNTNSKLDSEVEIVIEEPAVVSVKERILRFEKIWSNWKNSGKFDEISRSNSSYF